jgi:uncharacterized protein DUF4129
MALLLLPGGLGAETISVGAYRSRLVEVQGRLRAGDWIGARAGARRLLEDQIAFGSERIEPDRSVLEPLARAAKPQEARATAARLAQLVAALPTGEATPQSTAGPDAKLLERVRAREALAELPHGGRLPEVKDGGVAAALVGFLRPVIDFLKDAWRSFWDWLFGLLPEDDSGSRIGLNLTTVTILVVALALVLAWVGWRVLRNRRRGAALAPEGPSPLPPTADDDPLSREANEWERYARELAAAGRAREAIRAWYHAVLVALYRAGTLHYRKGRTNWEYVSAVPPGTTWRAGFIELTRHFEREWYGRDASAPEALHEAEGMALHLLAAVRERAA